MLLAAGCAGQPQGTLPAVTLQPSPAAPTVTPVAPPATVAPTSLPPTATPASPPATPDPTAAPDPTATPTEPVPTAEPSVTREPVVQEYPVPDGAHPHDVAPAPRWRRLVHGAAPGRAGLAGPATGETRQIPLGAGSSPHGVIVGPDGAPWITDSGLNAIVRVDPAAKRVQIYPLPAETGYANLNTATFDNNGILWFTGQSGVYGRLNPGTGQVEVFNAPRGRGPYGIATTPGGDVYYASLAGSHIARIDRETGVATVLEPPTAGQGARRVWSDSQGTYLGQPVERRPGSSVRSGRRRRGASGGCPATVRRPTRSLSMSWTKYG